MFSLDPKYLLDYLYQAVYVLLNLALLDWMLGIKFNFG